jgi:hypothetical protein
VGFTNKPVQLDSRLTESATPAPLSGPSLGTAPSNTPSMQAPQSVASLAGNQTQTMDADGMGATNMPILRVVNSKRITLNFELKDTAGMGVTGVDLFVTRDMRNWRKTEAAHPVANSHVIEVKDEGLYGFLMVARTSALPAAMPKLGDLPQVLVNVDTTKPVVQLSGVELSLTPKIPTLVIRWSAQDRNFNRRPITISYSETSDGPWVPLAANIENTGRHEIPLTATIPHRMLLRIEAVDVAGNVGLAQTAEPIRLDLPWSAPTSREDKPSLVPSTPEVSRTTPSIHVTTVQGD